MKKWILIGLFGVVGLGVLYWLILWRPINQTIDPDSPAGQSYAEGFKTEFAASCVKSAERATGGMDDATKEKVVEMCACGAKATYESFKDEPPAALLSASPDSEAGKRIAAIMQGCAKESGF